MSRGFESMDGWVIGRLTVLHTVAIREPRSNRRTIWCRCRCECGKRKDVRSRALRVALGGKYPGTKSCGCLKAERCQALAAAQRGKRRNTECSEPREMKSTQ